MKLTKKIIEGLIYKGPAPRRDARWDDEIAGLGIRIYPSGKKTFILSYRINNRKRLMVLGDFGVLTLDQARKMAREQLVGILNDRDPLAKKEKASKEQTTKAFCELYMSRYAKVHKKSWHEDEKRLRRHIIPKWGNRSIGSIQRTDVTTFHGHIGQTAPYQANRTLRLLSKMFDLAIQWGFLEESHPNPAKNIRLFKEEKRDRWVKPTELPQLAQAIDLEPNRVARNAIWLYLLTGARKSELLQAKWADIDWERRELKIPETKAGRVHYIPLSTPAYDLLKSITPTQDNPYILPGHIKGKPLVNISKPWKRICTKADLKDVRLHDLRRTVGSWLAQSGNSLHLIGKILNHSNQSTTAVYARFAQDQGREALEEYGEKIFSSLGKDKPQVKEIRIESNS
jgi:integrase